LRLYAAQDFTGEWLELLAVAERYADDEIGIAELGEARRRRDEYGSPRTWSVDLRRAFDTDEALTFSLKHFRKAQGHYSYLTTDRDYHLVLPRYRLFEELLGPNPRPTFSPSWRTDTAIALASQIYESREFSAMPILADALQDAGCDNTDILAHCRDTSLTHVRGCWIVDLVLGKS
jgi:hypothetical protein